jgi:lipase
MTAATIRSFTSKTVTAQDGTSIYVADWAGGPQTLVCAPGLASNSMAFAGLATELSDYRVLAYDCRGRGASSMNGPYGIEYDASDLLAVMDSEGIDRATLVGHSLGAYIISAVAADHPERVERAVLVDGGYWSGRYEGDPDELMREALQVYLKRLDISWNSVDDLMDYVRSLPMYSDGIDPYAVPYLRHDLGDKAPPLRSRVDPSAMSADWKDVLDSPRVAERLRKVQAPALLLRAPLGLTGVGDEVIPDETLKQIKQYVPHLEDADIPGTNHNTIVQSVSGAKAVAEAIRTAGFGQERP